MHATAAGWDEAVRGLLRKLRRPSALERDTLAQNLRVAYGCATVRDALVIAIERGLHGHDGRLGTIIRRCDVDGDLTHTVAGELHMSVRHFFRYRGEALRAVAVEIERALRAADATRDPQHKDALHAYALGRYLLQRFGRDDCRLSIAWLERAVAAAPRLVDAWTALASANVSLALASAADANDAMARARSCIDHATQIAPMSPHVRATNAFVTLWETRNAKRARALALVALDHDDRTAQAHAALGWTSAIEGDFDAAARSFASASAAEPHSFRFLASEMTIPFFRGEYAVAAARARELLDVEPACDFVLGYLAEALNAAGRYAETVELLTPRDGEKHAASVMTAYARALALVGDRRRALDIRSAFGGPAVMRASIDLALGEPARALDLLERALGEDNGLLAIVNYDPVFEPLRAEPRYARAVSRYTR